MRKALRKGSNNKCEEEGTQLKSPQKESESNLKLISEKEFTWHLKEIEQIIQRSLEKERLKGFLKKLKKVASWNSGFARSVEKELRNKCSANT